MRLTSRRDFLHDSAFAAAALAAAGAELAPAAEESAKKGSANDQLRVAVVGTGGRGGSHLSAFAGNKRLNTVVTVVCDADEGRMASAAKSVEKAQGTAPRMEQDVRKVVEAKDVDIVSIATPNHWHALGAIWAMMNGKDVYVEKPVSHNVSEGRRMVEVARKFRRICQTGTQCRSMVGMRQAMDFLHAGKIGKLRVAHGLCYKPRGSIGLVKGEQPIPKGVNYDLWCGPAPMKPLMRQRLHYDWHWIWDTGNGDLGNQGIHQMDVARWGLKKDALCNAVISVGGRLGYKDDGQTPNTQIVVCDYGDCELIFEVRGLPTKDYKGAKVGNVFYGTDGYLVCPGYDGAVAYNPQGEVIARFKGGDDHFGNFIKAVRSRKVSDLTADIEEGHLSSALCHLGNISYLLGTDQPFSAGGKAFGDDKAAYETFERMMEHLKDNRVPTDGTTFRVGKRLTLDAKSETFPGDSRANQLLTREYRKGFEVPAKV